MNIQEWLQQDPLPSEIKIRDGAKYIPYKVIVEKLNQLSPNGWSTKNFIHQYITIGKKVVVSGSVEVVVSYEINKVAYTRTLSGSANFVLNRSSNVHPTPTIKSLAVMNAVKVLGKQFGWGLNDDIEDETIKFSSILSNDDRVKPDPDLIILRKYDKACSEDDDKTKKEIEDNYNIL